MKTIFLIGFMGSGKSSIGEALAKQINKPSLDSDKLVEEVNQETIPAIFNREGEAGFRVKETSALERAAMKDAVISTGGGIVERPQNKVIMNQNGIIIYLHTAFETIVDRLKEDETRPLWNQDLEKRKALYEKRLPRYKEWADYVIQTDDMDVEAIVEKINSLLMKS
ncbi:shikimate kinase [Pontibacillus salicampi]|uniref:Shikimate kinase n=1 Tax=Pontibacillus salicampi TaxID=1449801 RepID=A0ABV6LJW9_9BACI